MPLDRADTGTELSDINGLLRKQYCSMAYRPVCGTPCVSVTPLALLAVSCWWQAELSHFHSG